MPGAAGGREVFHPTAVRIGAVVAWAVIVWWLAAVVLGGRAGTLWHDGPVLVLVALVVYVLFWRPAVLVDDAGVVLRNLFRDVHLPWATLESVQTRYALTLVGAGRGYRSWAASAPGRPSPVPRGVFSSSSTPPSASAGGAQATRLPDQRWQVGSGQTNASRTLSADSGAAAFLVERRWQAWAEQGHARRPRELGSPPPVFVVLDRRLVAALVAVAAATLAALLTG